MSSGFTNTQLFGGAITASIPSGFADVSTIRQVPDNQEVYLSTTGFTSLTFDITERVFHLATDAAALEYHFADIVAEGDTKQIHSVSEKVDLPSRLPSGTPILALRATTTPRPVNNRRPLDATSTQIYFTLIRLVEKSTDIVIALNVPQIPDAGGQDPQLSDDQSIMENVWREVLMTFEINNWGLFDAGESIPEPMTIASTQ